MTDNTPLGDQLVLTERHRILALADELQRHGKLTASNLRTFSEMRLEVQKLKVSVSHDHNGTATVEVEQDVKITHQPAYEVNDIVLVSDDASNQPIPEHWSKWVDVPCRIDIYYNPHEHDTQYMPKRKGGRHYLVYALDPAKHGRAGRWVAPEQMRALYPRGGGLT